MQDTVCYRHPDRAAGVRCQRCDKVICPSCMHQASVGFHCPECVRQGRQKVYTAGSLPGTDAIVTKILIAVNVAVFLADAASGSSISGGGGITGLTLDGGLVGAALDGQRQVVGVDAGEWYRIITSGFLHDGLMHIGFNMLILWMLGQQLEPALGRLRFTLLYFVGLLGGSFGVLALDPTQFTVGASGAVFGLFGAAVIVQRSRGINPFETGLGGLIAINLAITFLIPGISIGGHIGGLLGGAAAGALLVELPKRFGGSTFGPGPSSPPAAVVSLGATVALGVAFFAGSLWAASQWMGGGIF